VAAGARDGCGSVKDSQVQQLEDLVRCRCSVVARGGFAPVAFSDVAACALQRWFGSVLMLLFADADLQWRCWNVNGGRREGDECAGLAGA